MKRSDKKHLRNAIKTGALSPTVDAMGQAPMPADETRLFEDKLSQMAYQVFTAQFPDLVDSIVTFKILDTDLEEGRGVGAFILDYMGKLLYAPVISSDNQLKPFDLVYVKDMDRFVPLTNEWLEAVGTSALSSLGEGTKLPGTVATDVDIRNLMVPPTTGRYSYASVEVSPLARQAAEATEPLSRRIHKIAQMMPPDPMMAQQAAMAQSQPMALGQGDPNVINPEIWATFTEQFMRIHGTSPGQMLDSGGMDMDTLAKMYKSHQKTWDMGATKQASPAAKMQAVARKARPTMAIDPSTIAGAQLRGGIDYGQPVKATADVLDQLQKMDFHSLSGAKKAQLERLVSAVQSSKANESVKMAALREGVEAILGHEGVEKLASWMGNVVGDVAQRAGRAADEHAARESLRNVANQMGMGLSPYPNFGSRMQDLWMGAGRGAATGAAASGIMAARDRDVVDVPNAMLRGAVFGGALGSLGRMVGRSTSMRHLDTVNPQFAANLGGTLGGIGGGMVATEAKPGVISELTAPTPEVMRNYYREHPDSIRHASDQSVEQGVTTMVKHALAEPAPYQPKLLQFLDDAPNTVKEAFANLLSDNPRLLKISADLYGGEALTSALTPKLAGTVEDNKGLYVADRDTPTDEFFHSFGKAAPEAFKGVAMRGYHYKDTRPATNLAVSVQQYGDFTDARESGTYRLYPIGKDPVPAMVFGSPIDLVDEDRHVFPEDENKVTPVITKRYRDADREPRSLAHFPTGTDVARSHKQRRLAITGKGDFMVCDKLMGEQSADILMKGTDIYERLLGEKKAAVRRGLGVFVYKHGTHYMSSLPVRAKNISKSSDGVITGVLESEGFLCEKKFMIDPRSPITRPRRPKGHNLVVIPAGWKWVPLKKRLESGDFICDHTTMSELVHNTLFSMGAHEAVATDAGQSLFSVDGGRSLDKVAAIRTLAEKHYIHASAAEAMLKVASLEGKCRAIITSADKAYRASQLTKTAQGAPMPQQMAMDPAMQQPQQMAMDPAMQQQPMPPAMSPAVDPVSQAFTDVSSDLEGQMMQLQSAMGVLQMVQQRAMELSGQVDPAMAGMQGMQGAPPMDPAMQGTPSGAVMREEGPSAMEIQSQINPQFLEQASNFSQQGAFDAGAIGSLSQDGSLKQLGAEYASNFEDSLDDLGRTLLTLYMQEGSLKEELGDETYTKLETQLRDSFQNLGDLLLSLTSHTNMLMANA